MTRERHATIDKYLSGLSASNRSALERLRNDIRSAAPEAEECFSYGMPAFRMGGKLIAGFAAGARHCAYYPMSGSTIATLAEDLVGYETSKGAVRFAADRGLPRALVRKLVRTRIAELATETGRTTPARARSTREAERTRRSSDSAIVTPRAAPRFVALLRGINVGRAKRVAMADLRALISGLGCNEVRTLLNSGNVVFSASSGTPSTIARRIESGLVERLGVSTRVQVLTASAFTAVVEDNRLAGVATDAARLLVAFCDDPRRLQEMAALERQDWRPEALATGQHAAYLWCPESILASRVLEAVGRALADSMTTRNWATVKKIEAALQP